MQTQHKIVVSGRVDSSIAQEFRQRIEAEGFNQSVMIQHLIIQFLKTERNKDGATAAH
ncbi:MAG: hypothetical protein JAY75_23050 [Candidatus Thiodiazotropha taylori]|nr:hypothetical protein [Candidatus Thiodiazotropha taylori]MCG8095371.1 hypothetical protein [Candidatus Thiodiazotropha endolucinida]MCG7882925.1 hypothetical protein [Candidatus Thiodiazotropha taylori]MCG7888545.1 hypothetical protein [Candidatus Thiodiazotropha taylori]MCG7892261.1 hypothetical protein [Candidatus Thiodiazotropha taylori]